MLQNSSTFKKGDKVRSTFWDTEGQEGWVVDFIDGIAVVEGFSKGKEVSERPGCYQYSDNNLKLIERPIVKEIIYEEPEMDEFDDNCLSTCKPANHMCGKK